MNFASLLFATGTVAALTVSGTHAADLMVEQEAAPMAAAVQSSWDGPFIGVFGGYGAGTLEVEGAPPDTDTVDPAGWMLGVDAGFNFTLSQGIVVGVVGDLAWADMSDELVDGLGSATGTIDWLGSVRGRVGYDGGAFMPYLTAGLAFAHNTLDIVAVPIVDDSDDQTHVGWTVGAGVEFAATDSLSVDLLYRYSDYGTATYTIGGTPNDVSLTSHQLTVGLNYGF